jgi:phospholipase/carboxylesterase
VSHDRGIRPAGARDPHARLGSRLTARAGTAPTALAEEARSPGAHAMRIGRGRDAIVHVPAAALRADAGPAPLVVLLHGAGGRARDILPALVSDADATGTLLLAPDARADTWDVLRGGFGPDARFVDRALHKLLERHPVDPRAVAIAGFSDGASYALSLGLGNGDLFTHVIAFAPGFMAPEAQVGSPRLYITHGIGDRILPIDACSRGLVPRLERAGYDVTYREFDGGHVVPPALAAEAMQWFLRPAAPGGAEGG